MAVASSRSVVWSGLGLLALLSVSTAARGAVYITTVESKDSIVGERQSSAPALGYYVDTNNSLVGVTGSTTTNTRENRLPIVGLKLPQLGVGETIESALLTFDVTGARDQGNAHRLASLDTYLLNSANPSGTGTSFFYEGDSDASALVEFVGRTTRTDLGLSSTGEIDSGGQQVTFSPAKQRTYQVTGEALTLLQTFYTANLPNRTEAFLRFNSSANLNLQDSDRYNIDPASVTLTITAVPEPSTIALLGTASASLLVRRRRA